MGKRYKLLWNLRALDDRMRIMEYIAQDSFSAAVRVDDEIETQPKKLCDMPHMGRPGSLTGTRELLIQTTPFFVVYQVNSEQATIEALAVKHTSQQWPPVMSDI